ncbi:phytanoyl-CoA dioxygenase family protein [Sorangium sp. So ce834]|uniref:phytanoyl-CoA dioxygenase family protein n=1 Tax=Sorangium sp. So ce834 TaxID=3133321 RepID=UPI003F6284E6
MKLSSEDQTIFAEKGILCFKGLVSRNKTSPAKEAILNELARLRLRENGKWHTKQFDHVAPFNVTGQISQRLRHQAAFDEVIPDDLVHFVHELAGFKLGPQPHPQILVTPPQKFEWDVPCLGWHLDVNSPSRDVLPGIQIFVLLDDIPPRGGATLAIAGSHRLHSAKGSSPVSAHQALREDPVCSALFLSTESNRARFLTPQSVNGVPVQIIEMCGKAGDVYVMDMRILHAPSINASKSARLMLTQRYLK